MIKRDVRIFVLLYIIFITSFLVIVANYAKADEISMDWANDFPVPDGLDRWLSNDIKFSYKSDTAIWTLQNQMYTPDDLKSSPVQTNDRPWDSISLLSYYFRDSVSNHEERRYGIRAGAIGRASGGAELQRFVHDDLGLGQHPVWQPINDSEFVLSLEYGKINRVGIDTLFGIGELTTEYGFKLSNYVTEATLSQTLRRGFKGFYALTGLEGRFVVYNSTLDGRLFSSNEYTVDRVPLVADFRAGVGTTISDYTIELVYHFLTEEFEGQEGRHVFANLMVSYRY